MVHRLWRGLSFVWCLQVAAPALAQPAAQPDVAAPESPPLQQEPWTPPPDSAAPPTEPQPAPDAIPVPAPPAEEPPPPAEAPAPPAVAPAPAAGVDHGETDDSDDDGPRASRKKRTGPDSTAGIHLGSRLAAAAAAGGVVLAMFCGCGCLGVPLLYVAPCFSAVPCVAGPLGGLLAWGTSMLVGRRVGLLPFVLVGLGVSWVGAFLMLPAAAAVFFFNNQLTSLRNQRSSRNTYQEENNAAAIILVAAVVFTVVSVATLTASVGAVATVAAVMGRVRAPGESWFNLDVLAAPDVDPDLEGGRADKDDDDDRPRKKRRRRR